MKSVVLRENLKEGLSIVERMAVKSLSLPILHNILITTGKNILELSATDLEIGIRYRILAKNEGEGGIVVPAGFLSGFIGLLSDQKIILEGNEKTLVVDSENHHTEIKTLDPDEFPIIPAAPNKETAIDVSTKSFCEAISQVTGMASQSQTRPEITGVYICFNGNFARIAATDSFRLAERKISAEKKNKEECAFILPQKTAREISAVFSDRPGKISIYATPNQMTFRYSGDAGISQPHIEIVSRVIDGEYPNYQEVIPKQTETEALLDKQELINNIRAASIFSNKMNEIRFSLDPKNKKARFLSKNADLGAHTSSMRIDGEGKNVEISFNWKFFLEGVSQIKSEKVKIGINGEEDPALIKPESEEEEYLYVLMPIKA